MLPRVNVVLKLSRVSNLPTVWSNCIAGWVLGGGIAALPAGTGVSDVLLLLLLIIGASLAYSAGMIMNDAVDFKFDAEHRPDRPLPSGEITLSVAWALAIAFLGGGFILMILAGASPGCTLLLGFMIVGYNVLHKRWTGSVFLMGFCFTWLLHLSLSMADGLRSWYACGQWRWESIQWGLPLLHAERSRIRGPAILV